MTTRLTPTHNFNLNDETDTGNTMSSSEEEILDVELSQQLQLDCRSAIHTQQRICQQTVRAMTIPRPPLKSSWQGESRSSGFHFS